MVGPDMQDYGDRDPKMYRFKRKFFLWDLLNSSRLLVTFTRWKMGMLPPENVKIRVLRGGTAGPLESFKSARDVYYSYRYKTVCGNCAWSKRTMKDISKLKESWGKE
jgi:hypothetical protein